MNSEHAAAFVYEKAYKAYLVYHIACKDHDVMPSTTKLVPRHALLVTRSGGVLPMNLPRLPRKGETIRLEAHGKTLLVRRNDASPYVFVATVDGTKYVRFGTPQQIRADIAAFLETGGLPRGVDGWR